MNLRYMVAMATIAAFFGAPAIADECAAPNVTRVVRDWPTTTAMVLHCPVRGACYMAPDWDLTQAPPPRMVCLTPDENAQAQARWKH